MSDSLFPDLGWHHAGFSVADIEAAIAFWCGPMGFTLEFRKHIAPIDTHLCFLRRGPVRLEFFQRAGSRPVPEHRLRPNTDLGEQGTKHPAFAVDDAQAALETLWARKDVAIAGIIRRIGDPMVEEADPRLGATDPRAPAAAFFFRDPNGILVEIVRRRDFAE
jgi:methylmalonyl-CoA/ethylmalonyl-CoA epimerase